MPVSIITVAKDNEIGLVKTFESVISQSYTEWELILVIAESEDETLERAFLLEKSNARVRVIKQRGVGIYSAMNTGLRHSREEYVWFMNSGDIFADQNSLGFMEDVISKSSANLVIGQHRIRGQSFKSRREFSKSPSKISSWRFAFNRRIGCHQAMIFRTKKLKDLDGYKLNYSLASDFQLVLQLLLESPGMRLKRTVTEIESGGVADVGIQQVYKEKHQIRVETLGGSYILLLSCIWTFLARTKIRIRHFFQDNF